MTKRHQDTHDPESPQDFIDVYLAEQEKVEELNILDLTACIHDFFVAGTETLSTTLKWILLNLTLHQHVQDRLSWPILHRADIHMAQNSHYKI